MKINKQYKPDSHFVYRIYLTSIIFAFISCKSRPELSQESSDVREPISMVHNSWAFQGSLLVDQSIQPDCMPEKHSAVGPLKGSIILLHGFTGCPQQFSSAGQELSQYGFNVYIPLLPGHGYTGLEGYRGLPSQKESAKIFNKFILDLEKLITQEDTPQKMIGGVSFGATLAAAAVTKPGSPFKRALLITPVFGLNQPTTNNNSNYAVKTPVSEIDPKLAQKTTLGWGEDCVYETSIGRSGYCRYTIDSLLAITSYGESLVGKKLEAGIQSQLIGVERDPFASNKLIQMFLKNNKTVGCNYPFPANHSLISAFDSPDENKFWLASLMTNMIRFFSAGDYFRTTGKMRDGLLECSQN